jgi:ribosomal protein S18 acetylase RimI-like enzyme
MAAPRFRPTRAVDLAFVLALEGDADTRPYLAAWSREDHEAALGDPDVAHWILEQDGEPVGLVILRQIHEPRVELKRIAIARKGSGLGRHALHEACRVALEDWGAEVVWLDVLDDNRRALDLYESEGFRAVDTRPAVDAGCTQGGTSVIMELRPASAPDQAE